MMSSEETAGTTDSEAAKQDDATSRNEKASETTKKSSKSNSILLVPYPKFIFMYPTLIVAAVAAIVMYFGGYSTADPTQTLPVVMTSLFLIVMMINMFVIIFDFPRATSLTLVFVLVSAAMASWLVVIAKPDILPSIQNLVSAVRPVANTAFFGCTAIAMILMYGAVFVSVRFNYWELRNNELLHHHGILSDLKRYPAPNLRVDKEINDVFEFMLLGAGRLILHPTTEKRAIVLNNILFVGNKERELTRVLGSIKVQIGGDSSGRN
jgi:hypothetical protein